MRLCPSIRIDREEDGKRRLCTSEKCSRRWHRSRGGFTAVRLELADALDDEMKLRGECAPRYPQEVLGQISVVSGPKEAAGTTMDVTVAADMNLSTDGLTYLALRCERNEVNLPRIHGSPPPDRTGVCPQGVQTTSWIRKTTTCSRISTRASSIKSARS